MKVYNLRCEHDHRFEGWFSSEQDYDAQLSSALICCPICSSSSVSRLPSAPKLRKSANAAPDVPHEDAHTNVHAKVMQLMRDMVVRSEDVGERFAEEARRMHYEEIPERAIRGTATRDECEALADEGIAVLPLPPALKQPLQ